MPGHRDEKPIGCKLQLPRRFTLRTRGRISAMPDWPTKAVGLGNVKFTLRTHDCGFARLSASPVRRAGRCGKVHTPNTLLQFRRAGVFANFGAATKLEVHTPNTQSLFFRKTARRAPDSGRRQRKGNWREHGPNLADHARQFAVSLADSLAVIFRGCFTLHGNARSTADQPPSSRPHQQRVEGFPAQSGGHY